MGVTAQAILNRIVTCAIPETPMSRSTWFRLLGLSALLITAGFVLPAWTQGAKGPLDREGKNGVGMKFVLVKKGKFLMGSPKGEKERRDDEEQHEVELTKDYYLGVSAVTQKEFRIVMGYNPSYFSNDARGEKGEDYRDHKPGGGRAKVKGEDTEPFPVENVSYVEAVAFCVKLAEREKGRLGGWRYGLPTEAQWEYACRGGPNSSAKPFHFDEPSDSLSHGQANFNSQE